MARGSNLAQAVVLHLVRRRCPSIKVFLKQHIETRIEFCFCEKLNNPRMTPTYWNHSQSTAPAHMLDPSSPSSAGYAPPYGSTAAQLRAQRSAVRK